MLAWRSLPTNRASKNLAAAAAVAGNALAAAVENALAAAAAVAGNALAAAAVVL